MHVCLRQLLSSSSNHTAAGGSLNCYPGLSCSWGGGIITWPHRAEKLAAQAQPLPRCNAEDSPPGKCSSAGLPPQFSFSYLLALPAPHLTPSTRIREGYGEQGVFISGQRCPPALIWAFTPGCPPGQSSFACLFPSPAGLWAVAASLLHGAQYPMADYCRWDITGKKSSKPGRWEAAPPFSAAPSNYPGFPVSSMTMCRIYHQLHQSPVCKHPREPALLMGRSYLHIGNFPT